MVWGGRQRVILATVAAESGVNFDSLFSDTPLISTCLVYNIQTFYSYTGFKVRSSQSNASQTSPAPPAFFSKLTNATSIIQGLGPSENHVHMYMIGSRSEGEQSRAEQGRGGDETFFLPLFLFFLPPKTVKIKLLVYTRVYDDSLEFLTSKRKVNSQRR